MNALITGASGGIGKDFAYKFAANGYDVVLVARSEDKLNAIAEEIERKHNVQTQVIPMDLIDGDAPQALYDQLTGQGISVDVLVNNAGFASYGYFHELDMTREMNMIQLNIATLTALTRLFLPGMVERKHGKVLNVASTAAFQPGPLMAVYYATKAYVLHFSEAIANELKDTGVNITALCPGPTESGFQERAAMEESKLVQNDLMSSQAVVDEGYDALMQGKTVVIPGFQNKMQTMAPRFLPRGMVTNIVRNVQDRVGH